MRGHVHAKVDRVEATVLASLVAELLELLGEDEQEDEQDPLAALVGMPTGDGSRPQDPGLARLFPDAYRDEAFDGDTAQVEAAAKEFRRYTEADLRATKQAHASVVLAGLLPLREQGGLLELDRGEVDAWLGCLNDLRLVLGTRLEVTEDTELDPSADDSTAQALHVYGFLGWLQESLLGAVDPVLPGG
jgi:hypothetical protein